MTKSVADWWLFLNILYNITVLSIELVSNMVYKLMDDLVLTLTYSYKRIPMGKIELVFTRPLGKVQTWEYEMSTKPSLLGGFSS